jgi:hypothetical protein
MRSDTRIPLEGIKLVELAEAIAASNGTLPNTSLDVAGAPALQRVLAAPGFVARQPQEFSGLEIIARAREPLPSQPLPGDIVIRIIEGGAGHASVVASPGLLHTADLAARRLRPDSQSAEGFVHVVEATPWARRASEGFARGLTDPVGRLLGDLVLLRLATMPPTVVTVPQPSAAGVQPSPVVPAEPTSPGEFLPVPDTVEPTELTIAGGRLELTNTPLLSTHRGTQPDLILRWNDMTDPAGVDVVVHFHGYSSDRQRMSLRRKELYSGLDFSNPDTPSDTRPGRTAPTLGILPRGSYTGDAPDAKNPERYSFPALVTPRGIRDLIAYSLGQFQSATGASKDLSTRRLILTAHSGGGAALTRALANNTPDEIHVFDALYGDASALVSWVNARIAAEIQAWTAGKGRADGGLYVLYRRGGTEGQSLRVNRVLRSAIAGAPADAQPALQAAYRVLRTSVSHGEIPRRFGWRLLASVSADLPDTTPADQSGEAVLVSPTETVPISSAAEEIGDGSPFVAQALDQCWSQTQTLRSTLSAADNASRISRTKIGSESRVSVDHNPYSGLRRGQLEAVIRAGYTSNQMPETLMALWAKEGSLRMVTSATPVPVATTAENARALFRSNVYYVDLGSDYFVVTRYDPVRRDNVWDNRDEAAPGHEAHFVAQVRGLVLPGLLEQDISAAINAELTVSAGPPFTVTPSLKFYTLSLLLMDALFTRMQRNTFPQLAVISEPLNYIQWNIGTTKFTDFLASAEQHRQEPAYRLPSGDQMPLEQWALHSVPRSKEWRQGRVNAIRFMHYLESYRPIFASVMNLIKPGIEDIRPASTLA